MFDEDVPDPRLRTLLRAFADDDISCWLVPEQDQRYPVYREWFGMVLAQSERVGAVISTDDATAVQVWLSGVEHPPAMVDDENEQRLPELVGAAAPRFRRFGEITSSRHPVEPHQYLALIGVEPTLQNTGLGTRVLTESLRRWDADGVATYLEASSRRSRGLYLRLGFRDLGEPIELPGGPMLYPMWREPGGAPA